jgi:hypothetical protein
MPLIWTPGTPITIKVDLKALKTTMPTTKPASPELKSAWLEWRETELAWQAEMRRLDPWNHSRRDRDEWSRGEDGTTLRTLWEAREAAALRWEAIASGK